MDSATTPDTEAVSRRWPVRRWPVRLILFGIVFALVLPALVFSAVLVNRVATVERARSEQAARAAALRAAEALDRELGNLSAALLALATSSSLLQDDPRDFHAKALTVANALGHPLVLSDREGRQLLSTRVPPGTPTPPMASMDTVRRTIESRTTVVSDLFTGTADHEPSLGVMYPVMQDGRVRSVLAMSLRPAFLSSLLQQQGLPPGWLASVVDGNNVIIARTADPERYIGRRANRDLIRPDLDHDMWIGPNLDGKRVLAASQRLHLANWTVGIGVELSTIEAPLRGTLMLIAVTGAVTFAIACALAWQLAASVARPLQRLARAGNALAHGLPVLGVRSMIAEVDAVSNALVRATRDLRARADALAAERAQLETVIETVPVGLIIADAPGGRIVAGNRRLETMLGHPLKRSGSLEDYSEWIAFHPDGRRVQPAEFPLARVLQGEPTAELQCRYQRGDGGLLWIQLVAAPIHAPDGSLTGGLVALLDIDEVVRAREEKARSADLLEIKVAERTAELEATNARLVDEMAARTAAEEQLRQAQKMEAVGQLTGGIAHDFNNLLTIVIGSLDLLRRRAEDDRSRRLLDNALEGASRAATLTARLLAFSRRQPLMPQPLDPNRLVSGMSDLFHRTLGEAIQIETILAGGVWQTHADPNQLENALLNLAVNGRDAIASAGRPGGRIQIETSNATLGAETLAHHPDVDPGDYVQIAVTDTGTGMPPDILARVFEPFYTTKPQGQGTGLGLSQVHGFVKQSGGHVEIRTAPGQGTTVAIYLPRLLGDAPAPAATGPDRAEDARPTLVILLVEDDGGVRRYSVEALHDLGHTVLEAGDAQAALRLLDAHPEIDLLLTDVVLPAMNGPQLADEARRRRPTLPVLFASGYTAPAAEQDSLLPPDAPLLRKPFTVQALARKLNDVMELRPAGLEPATKPL